MHERKDNIKQNVRSHAYREPGAGLSNLARRFWPANVPPVAWMHRGRPDRLR